jgi:hypothetical protein
MSRLVGIVEVEGGEGFAEALKKQSGVEWEEVRVGCDLTYISTAIHICMLCSLCTDFSYPDRIRNGDRFKAIFRSRYFAINGFAVRQKTYRSWAKFKI